MYLVLPSNFIPNHPQTLTQGGRIGAYWSPDCKTFPRLRKHVHPSSTTTADLLSWLSTSCQCVHVRLSPFKLTQPLQHAPIIKPFLQFPNTSYKIFPLRKYQIPIRSNLAHIIIGRTLTVFQFFISHSHQVTQHRTASSTVPPSTPRSDKPTQLHHLAGEARFRSFATLLLFRLKVVYPDGCCK